MSIDEQALRKWQQRMPAAYRGSVLGQAGAPSDPDDNLIHRIKHYRSLMPMAMEAREPMFQLTSADGAIGAHQANVQQCFADFETLCREIARRVGLVR
jgi:hypothetical protein